MSFADPSLQADHSILDIEGAGVAIQLGRQDGDPVQVLGLLNKRFLAPGAAAAGQVLAESGGILGLDVLLLGQLLAHCIQHPVRPALDLPGLIYRPFASVPIQPVAVNVVKADVPQVLVDEAPGVAGIVVGIGPGRLDRRRIRWRSSLRRGGRGEACCLRFFPALCRRCPNLYAVLHRCPDGLLAVGHPAPALVPLGAHHAGLAEDDIHQLLVPLAPEGQDVAERLVGAGLGAVPDIQMGPPPRHEIVKTLSAPFGGTCPADDLFGRHLRPAPRQGPLRSLCRGLRLVLPQILPVHLLHPMGAVGKLILRPDLAAGDSEEPPLGVHLHIAPPPASLRQLAGTEDVYPRPGRG